MIFAGYVGVHIHNSLASAVIANTIFGANEAVSVSSFQDDPEFAYDPASAGVIITGNHVLGGSSPENDAALEIVVENND